MYRIPYLLCIPLYFPFYFLILPVPLYSLPTPPLLLLFYFLPTNVNVLTVNSAQVSNRGFSHGSVGGGPQETNNGQRGFPPAHRYSLRLFDSPRTRTVFHHYA